MILVQPEPGRGEQKTFDLGTAVIKDTGAPAGMLPLVGIAVLVAAGAVKFVKALGVLAEVGRHPVQQHGNAVFVHVVDKPHEILGGAEPGGRSEIPGALIPPGVIQGMLRHRQQLDGGISHFLDVCSQLPAQILVIDEIPVVPFFPGTQVNFIDIQRSGINGVLGKLLAEGGIAPAEAGNIIELAGGAGRVSVWNP